MHTQWFTFTNTGGDNVYRSQSNPPSTWHWADIHVGVHGNPISKYANRVIGLKPKCPDSRIPPKIIEMILPYFIEELPGLILVPGGVMKDRRIIGAREYHRGLNLALGRMIYAVRPFRDSIGDEKRTKFRLYAIYYRGTIEEEKAWRKKRIKKVPKRIRDEWEANHLRKDTFPKHRVLVVNTMWVVSNILTLSIEEVLGKYLVDQLEVRGEELVPVPKKRHRPPSS